MTLYETKFNVKPQEARKKNKKDTLMYTYEVCPEGIQPCNMKNRDIY